ncbi:hypothetical protein ABW21_db0201564 [Orbilia brochopaga]|nr:hypothetical protein ABW21_db0201564 [Drechslerella brochopaga]
MQIKTFLIAIGLAASAVEAAPSSALHKRATLPLNTQFKIRRCTPLPVGGPFTSFSNNQYVNIESNTLYYPGTIENSLHYIDASGHLFSGTVGGGVGPLRSLYSPYAYKASPAIFDGAGVALNCDCTTSYGGTYQLTCKNPGNDLNNPNASPSQKWNLWGYASGPSMGVGDAKTFLLHGSSDLIKDETGSPRPINLCCYV